MRTTDNNWGCTVPDDLLPDLKQIGDRKLSDLIADNPDLLIFPNELGAYDDELGKLQIFQLNGSTLTTGNLMGFMGINDTRLTISSRFQQAKQDQDHFLHYLLQKVFALNIFNLPINAGTDHIWDIFLFYIFPFYLTKALNQGLYKAYRHQDHNDSNVRGRIDIAAHIRHNRPFNGRIAYTNREHTYDNDINRLIRHTMNYLNRHPIGQAVLNSKPEIRSGYSQVTQITPGYQPQHLQRTLSATARRLDHPYFTEYEPLRKLCQQILRRESIGIDQAEDQIFGLLFDGAWLWEEYLNTLLAPLGYVHPKNKLGKAGNPLYVFDNNTFSRFPDFYHQNKTTVLDAKYKPLHRKMSSELSRDDLNQLIAYLYNLKAGKGAFIYPHDQTGHTKLGTLNGFGADIFYYGLKIPSGHNIYVDFVSKMAQGEEQLKCYFQQLALA